MRSAASRLLAVIGTIAGGATLACAKYRKEIRSARQRIESARQFIDSIEFAESGNGPAVLVIHGLGGGFDQGLLLGRLLLGGDYRIIAPSRFGYLGTPLPADASPEAQAEAYVRVLDTLQLDRIPMIAVSAGAPSAMQLCLRHPERCSALVLVVPLTYAPGGAAGRAPSRTRALRTLILNKITTSDFLFWTATRLAHPMILRTILGTPVQEYQNATHEERRGVDAILRSFLPISRRVAGMRNDAVVASNLTRYPLEEIRVPMLVISAADCRYRTYEKALYTAEQVHDGKFLGFQAGGHLLVGHEAEVRSEVTGLLKGCLEATAIAV